MEVEEFPVAGVFRLVAPRFRDERGFFSEVFSAASFERSIGFAPAFMQDNHSMSRDVGVIRGLHCQRPPFAQAKLIRVTRGRIFDVAIDIRRSSPTYGRWIATELSAENWAQLFIPAGFLHGYCTLEPDTEVQYKVDAPYAPDHEAGVIWNDEELAIEWPTEATVPILSGKDQKLPRLADFESPFA